MFESFRSKSSLAFNRKPLNDFHGQTEKRNWITKLYFIYENNLHLIRPCIIHFNLSSPFSFISPLNDKLFPLLRNILIFVKHDCHLLKRIRIRNKVINTNDAGKIFAKPLQHVTILFLMLHAFTSHYITFITFCPHLDVSYLFSFICNKNFSITS